MTRLRTQLTAMTLACAGLVAAPPAKADPGTVAVALSTFLTVETAVAVTVAIYTYGAYVLTGYAIYGSIAARNKAKRAAAAARAAYNAGLQDRSITALTAAPLRRIVYGRCDTGGDLVAMFTTDKTTNGPGFFRGVEITKHDAFKHLIVVWAAHQCAAVNDVKIDGIPIGALDADGWATGDEWKTSDPRPNGYGQIAGNLRSQTLPSGSTITSVTLISGADGNTHTPIAGGAGGWSFAGTTLTLPNSVTVAGFAHTPDASDTWDIAYSSDDAAGTSCVRVRHFLGSPTQAASAELMALLPDKWTANHRLRGRCYSWITLDLTRPQFQGGPPGMTADISGARVLDPRTGVTAWSDNPALCAYDYLRRIEGMNVTAAEVDVASVIAAANACDVSTSFTVGGSTVTGPLYTCNGAFMAGQAKEAVLIDICEAMAGFHTYSGTWRVLAGSWTPPVMDLTDDDLHGSISIVQAGEPSGELFNSVRGQYVPAGSAIAADIETYSNPTFVAADRRPLFTDVELPFTNSRARAKNISRIKVEQSRAGEVIFFPAKLRAWPLQTGDRVTVTSPEYGFTAKVFRVTDWQFGLRSPVGLTLQEDAADIYDLADAAIADPTPNTDLPSPWFVQPLASATAASGTAQLQRLGDGTILSRVLVSWPATTAAYMEGGGQIELAWREAGGDVTRSLTVDASSTQAYITSVRDGAFIAINVTAINSLGARSAPITIGHLVLGKQVAPVAVQGLSAAVVPGALKITRTPSTEADWDHTLFRYGPSWAAGTAVPGQADRSGITWDWPALGAYTIWAADVDTTKHVGTPVSVTVTVDSNILIGAGSSRPVSAALNRNPACNDPGAWVLLGGVAPQYLTGQTDMPGGTSLANMPAGSGSSVTEIGTAELIPISTDHTYLVEVLAQATSGAGVCYLGVAWYDVAGAYIDSGVASPSGWANGTFSYFGLVGGSPPTHAARYSKTFGAGTDAAIPSNARSCRLIALLNEGNGSFVQHAISDYRLVDVTVASAAQAAADAAQSTASGAATNASSALSMLATMRSNGYIDAAEKPALIKQWQAVSDEYGGIYAQAGTYGLGALQTAYYTATANLSSYLSGLSPSWSDTTTDTPITPATDQATWAAYYSARQTLLNAIADEAAKRAQWSQVSGSGKPADNATKNVVTYAASAPSSPTDGDIWIDTSVTPRTIRMRLAGTWQQAGTYVNGTAQLTDDANLGLTALWAGVVGSGKPADNATRNVVTYSGSAPSSPVDGDLWVDTSGTYAVFKLRSGGAWITGANALSAYNNLSGKPVALADINTTESSKLSGIADNATRNQVFFQDTDPVSSPGGVVDGAIWISSTKAWQRVSGAWKPYVGPASIDTGELVPGAATTLAEVLIGSVDVTGASFSGAPDSYSASYNLLGSVTFTPKVTGVANLYFSASLRVSGTFTASGPYNALVLVGINVDQDGDGVAEAGDDVAGVQIQQYLTTGLSISWSSPIAGRVQVSTVAGVSRTLRVYGQRNGDAATCTLINLRLGVEGINA